MAILRCHLFVRLLCIAARWHVRMWLIWFGLHGSILPGYMLTITCMCSVFPIHRSPSPDIDTCTPRFCANCMIGKRVRVFWPLDQQWYAGIVQQYDTSTGEHLLAYPDGDTEWVKIGENDAKQPPVQAAAAAAQGHIPPPPGGAIGTVGSDQSGRTAAEMEEAAAAAANALLSAAASADSATAATAAAGPATTKDGKVAGQPGAGGAAPNGATGAVPGPYAAMPGYQYPYYPPGYAQHLAAYGQPPAAPPGLGVPGAPGAAPAAVAPHPYAMVPPGSHRPHPGAPTRTRTRKSGPKSWAKEEDDILLNLVQSMRMPMKWSVVAHSLPGRTGKQCRERYVNHLNPRLKSSEWTPVEDATIFRLYDTTGSQWAKMAKMIPGRTDNGIKNRFHNLRRQLEREDEQRLRLSKPEDYPGEIYLSKIKKEIPRHLLGKSAELWESTTPGTMAVIAALSVLGETGSSSESEPKFGPFRPPATGGEQCTRCGLFAPSAHTGDEICSKTGWCQACTRVPQHLGSDLLRECLKLRKCPESEKVKIIDSMKI